MINDKPEEKACMTHRALLIDFGGTLFLPPETEQWLAAAARKPEALFVGDDSVND